MSHRGDTTVATGMHKPKAKLLSKASSVAILQEPFLPADEQRSSLAGSQDLVTSTPTATLVDGSSQAAVAVDISLRRGRITLATIAIVAAIVVLMQFFRGGYEIRRYDKATLDAALQKRLLDQYNSYSGNIVSVFSKPIELFVAACVQVTLLRFVSESLLRNEPSWKALYGALLLSACIGYLINNGFNALNAQLVDLEIESVMEASDLSIDDTAIAVSSDWQSRVSNVSRSVSENQPLNPITNTVLRNLLLPPAMRAKSMCDVDNLNVRSSVPLDTVEYGFPQRDWMKQLLTESLPTTSMQFLLNPTNKSANNHLASEDLPMNASIASNLVLYSVRLAADFTPMRGSLRDPGYKNVDDGLTYNISAAVRVGILPPDPIATDTDQRAWFLKNMNGYLTGEFNRTQNMTLNDIPMTFSRVDIAPNMVFDAVTFDFELKRERLADTIVNKTGARYVITEDEQSSTIPHSLVCDPWPALCVVQKRGPTLASELPLIAAQYYDAPAQIQGFSMCLNGNGTEAMEAGHFLSGGMKPPGPGDLAINPCSRTSNTSMLVVSVGKRLVAEALTENTTAYRARQQRCNQPGVLCSEFGGFGWATNVRKIYSFTVGRLSWTLTDVAAQFRATCNVSGGEQCQGLAVALAQTSSVSTSQRLVVSGGAIPTSALLPPQLNNFGYYRAYRQRPITLVLVNEPTRVSGADRSYDAAAGDILLRHNIHKITWNMSHPKPGTMCAYMEERVQRILDNHMYIEHPLQATYTAAAFYVLQNAVVKDVVTNNQSRMSTTNTTMLAFDGNTQQVALFISTPSTNAFLTQLGCLVLLIGVGASIVWATIVRSSTSRTNSLAGITNAEVIARAKLDEKTFPPLLLHRHVTSANDLSVDRRELDAMVIHLLSLQHRDVNQAAAVDPASKEDTDSSGVRLSVQV